MGVSSMNYEILVIYNIVKFYNQEDKHEINIINLSCDLINFDIDDELVTIVLRRKKLI